MDEEGRQPRPVHPSGPRGALGRGYGARRHISKLHLQLQLWWTVLTPSPRTAPPPDLMLHVFLFLATQSSLAAGVKLAHEPRSSSAIKPSGLFHLPAPSLSTSGTNLRIIYLRPSHCLCSCVVGKPSHDSSVLPQETPTFKENLEIWISIRSS